MVHCRGDGSLTTVTVWAAENANEIKLEAEEQWQLENVQWSPLCLWRARSVVRLSERTITITTPATGLPNIAVKLSERFTRDRQSKCHLLAPAEAILHLSNEQSLICKYIYTFSMQMTDLLVSWKHSAIQSLLYLCGTRIAEKVIWMFERTRCAISR